MQTQENKVSGFVLNGENRIEPATVDVSVSLVARTWLASGFKAWDGEEPSTAFYVAVNCDTPLDAARAAAALLSKERAEAEEGTDDIPAADPKIIYWAVYPLNEDARTFNVNYSDTDDVTEMFRDQFVRVLL